jgi:LysR family glycine cleavage system transcriptional activator
MSEPDWLKLPSLSSLRAFETTARAGSFAGAARALNVTQAAVAQQVRGLESELGVTLARRAGRSVALTDAGTRLATRLSEGFATIASGVDEVVIEQTGLPVQVSVTIFIAQSVLLPRMHEFWNDNPDIQVSMTPSLEAVDIASLGFDLAIRATVGPGDWPVLNAEFLCGSQMIVAGAPSLLGDEIPELCDLPWTFSRGTSYEEDRFRSIGLDPKTLKTVELGSPLYEISAAIQGIGLVITPEILVRDELATNRLREVPVSGLRTLNYYAVTPRGPVRPQAAKFIEWLKKVFAE